MSTNGLQGSPTGFLTANGSKETHVVTRKNGKPNRSKHAGKPYSTVTWAEIRTLVETPTAAPKDQARFVILSTYAEHDGRTHAVQRERGSFHGLAVDIDKGDKSIETLVDAVEAVTGGAAAEVYSSSSSKADDRKWRVLIPLAEPVAGADYGDTQTALFRLLAKHGVECDETLSRAGQPIYLPNVPPEKRGADGSPLFYVSRRVDGAALALTPDHPIVVERETMRQQRAADEAAAESRRAEYQARRLEHVRATGDDFDAIRHFNDNHSTAAVLTRYGFERQDGGTGSHWKSPLSTSGTYSTEDCGDGWRTVSNWARAHRVGREGAGGVWHGDAFDLFVHFDHGGDMRAAVAAYTAEVRPKTATVSTTPVATSTSLKSSRVAAYRPFPVDALPEPLSSFVTETAAAIVCDPAYVALPLLTATGAAIGTTRRLALKYDHSVPAIVWAVVVGESGTRKSAPMRSVLQYAKLREKLLRQEHAEEQREHRAALAAYEKDLAAWRSDRKTKSEPPEKPAEPVSRRLIVNDTTVEALAAKLADNPRGLLLARDELNGWFGGLDRYAKHGGGGDEAFYLSCYNAEDHAVDRRTGDRREIYVPQCGLWICGTIQPGTLRRALGVERRESGLLARLLLTAPPARPPKWSEDEVSPLTRQYLHDVLAKLYELQPDGDEEGGYEPRILRLSASAKAAYVAWHDEHGEELMGLLGDQKAAWSKLHETAARLALIIHEVKVATGKAAAGDVDAESMNAGIRLCEWFKHETTRTYAILDESDGERAIRQADDRLPAFVARAGGLVAVRDVVAGCRWIKNADEAERSLQRLVDAGRGRWLNVPTTEKGGRPGRLFELVEEEASAEPSKLPASEGFACADAGREPEVEAGEEYVEI